MKLWGRSHALGVLAEVLADAAAGHGQLVLLSGEAGIGKTALAADLVRTAKGHGVQVAWAACRQGSGSPSYWPWVQTMRAISQQPEVVDLGELVGLERASGRAAADASTDEDTARFSLFDRLSTVLTEAARPRPTAVVLDDLHWSDEPSLLALEFVSKHALTVPLLLVGTYREDEAGEALLRLAGGARIIELSGLAATDIAVLMTDLTGRVPGERLANDVWVRTNGNPFRAREVTRLPRSQHRGLGRHRHSHDVPTGVRAVLDARLSALSALCLTALRTAAVAGRDVDVAVVADALGWSSGDTVECLEEAVPPAGGGAPSSPGGRYRFVHELFRDTAYDGLTRADACARHLAVARALERSRAVGSPVGAAELATHFAAAATLTDGSQEVLRSAVTYSTRAAQEAAARLADEDAGAEYERALGFAVDADTRLELLLALGHAQYRCGRAAAARGSFRSAADLARERKDPDTLARAALGWHRVGVRSGTADRPGVALLYEALAMLGDDARPSPPLLLAAWRAPAPTAPVRDPAGPTGGGTDTHRSAGSRARAYGWVIRLFSRAACWPCTTRSGCRAPPRTAADRRRDGRARAAMLRPRRCAGPPAPRRDAAGDRRPGRRRRARRLLPAGRAARPSARAVVGDDPSRDAGHAARRSRRGAPALGGRACVRAADRRARCDRRRRHAELRAGPAWWNDCPDRR